MSKLKKRIAEVEKVIRKLPCVSDLALIGSAAYLPDPADIDFAVLLDDLVRLDPYFQMLSKLGWQKCGDYDMAKGTWMSVRSLDINLMLTTDPVFFRNYKQAMEVCKALHLTEKEDRIAVCQIVRDGKRAEEVNCLFSRRVGWLSAIRGSHD